MAVPQRIANSLLNTKDYLFSQLHRIQMQFTFNLHFKLQRVNLL